MDICKNRAYDLLKRMSFQRIAGTTEEKECAQLLLEECQKAGVDAYIEDFEIDMPLISKAYLEADGKTIPCIGVGKTGSCEDLEGEFLYVENGLPVNFINAKDKIVILNGLMKPEIKKLMIKAGVKGIILTYGTLFDSEQMIKELRPRNQMEYEDDEKIPTLLIHITHAQEIIRNNTKQLKMTLIQDDEHKGTSHNVIATIKGSEYENEIISFSAHYDSVIYGKGAWDNATGSVTIMELMHYFVAHPPKRTLKFIWCGSEEIGLVGSKKYCEMHEEELKNMVFNINVDMTGVVLGYDVAVCTCEKACADFIDYLGKIEGFPIETSVDTYSSDSTSFAMKGVPAMTFARLSPKGGAEIHNRRDTLEPLDAQVFINTVNFMSKFASHIVNASYFPVSKVLPDDIKEKLDKLDKMFNPKKKEVQ